MRKLLSTVVMFSLLGTPALGESFAKIPIGHWGFCQRLPDECLPVKETGPLKMTPGLMKLLRKVDRDVNGEYPAGLDQDVYGREEYWTYPRFYADCEDYALEKRRRLNQAGIPLSVLLLTIVMQKKNGEGHLVLTVRTTDGDVILDNLDNDPSAYTFYKRQSTRHAGKWVLLDKHHPSITTSGY